MTLYQLKNKFQRSLGNIYPMTEVTSIYRILIKHKLNLDAAEIVLEGTQEIDIENLIYFENSLARLLQKEPIQYVIGETIFDSLTFTVTPDVLIPRPETEELVTWIVGDLKIINSKKRTKILDIGTGSGCIAISLAKRMSNMDVSALDLSVKALQIAEENAELNKAKVRFFEADILKIDKLPQKYDIIVSNPPYVREKEKLQMHENVLKHEPKEALFVFDEDPLLFYDKIGDLALKSLSEKGSLYFEINQYLGEETSDLLVSKGFSNITIRKDYLGKDRMIKAQI